MTFDLLLYRTLASSRLTSEAECPPREHAGSKSDSFFSRSFISPRVSF